MSGLDQDVAAVRAGLLDSSNAIVPSTMTETAFEGLAALDRLAARVAELEGAIASAMTSLATGPGKDGYAYAALAASEERNG